MCPDFVCLPERDLQTNKYVVFILILMKIDGNVNFFVGYKVTKISLYFLEIKNEKNLTLNFENWFGAKSIWLLAKLFQVQK